MAMEAFLNVSFKAYVDRILTARSRFLSKLLKRPIVLKANYQNIPAIVEYENRNNDKLIDMAFAGLLTRNELFERINERMVSDDSFNQYYTFQAGAWSPVIVENTDNEMQGVSQEQLQAQANLRGTVGGVQGILAIQASVASGTTDYTAALATLIEIYGFSMEVAVAILGTPGQNNQNGNNEINEGTGNNEGSN
jgi:hypothetical protein